MRTNATVIALVVMLSGCAAETSPASSEEALGHSDAVQHVAISTGVELAYVEQGRPNGEVVIFVHGYTDSHHAFDLDLRRLPRRYHAYAIDLRGHGDSSKPACCYTQTDFADDVVAFMDELGIPSATIVGHSMGSFVAQKVALDHPTRVDALVLIGSAPTAQDNAVALDLAAYVATLEDPIDPAFVRDFQASTFFRPIPSSFLDTAVQESLKVPATVWQQALDGLIAEDFTPRLHEITAPTAIFWGDQDVFFGAADQVALDTGIPDSTLYVYPDTGHGLQAEAPRELVHDLVRFLR